MQTRNALAAKGKPGILRVPAAGITFRFGRPAFYRKKIFSSCAAMPVCIALDASNCSFTKSEPDYL